MRKETKTVVYDGELRLEAYRFEGRKQPFPNHFHEYYVLGFVEGGRRVLSCKNREYIIEKGDIILFHPGDNHGCVQIDEESFDYRGFHISKETMAGLAEEITGKRELPGFSQNVIRDEEAAGLCGICLYYLLENIALTYTMASNVGVIISVAPFFTAISAHIWMKTEEKLQIRFFLGFVFYGF